MAKIDGCWEENDRSKIDRRWMMKATTKPRLGETRLVQTHAEIAFHRPQHV